MELQQGNDNGRICAGTEFISKFWLCSTTILAVEDDGPRCSRRVDDIKVKKELMGCQSWALVATMAWAATMASMVGWHKGALTWKPPGACDGGDEWWRRWLASTVASNGGVDGWRRWWLRMVGVGGWRRWFASMVDWGLRHGGH